MISRYEAYLNDVALSSLDTSIYITDIAYSVVTPQINTVRLSGRNGAYSSGNYVQENRIAQSLMVRQYSTQNRQTVIGAIIAWASKPGWLKTSDRANQKIYVKCSKYPAVTSALRWTDVLSLEFVAYDYPFWVDEIPNKETITSGNECDVFVPGAYPTDVEAVITPSATITSLHIECGDTFLELSGISVPANQTITISYTDDHHILSIESNEVSLLNKRTPESSDDLVLNPGTNTVSFTANASATCTLIIKGVYL